VFSLGDFLSREGVFVPAVFVGDTVTIEQFGNPGLG
jgi:hypothetical protein